MVQLSKSYFESIAYIEQIREEDRLMKIIVTGATGQLGNFVIQHLLIG